MMQYKRAAYMNEYKTSDKDDMTPVYDVSPDPKNSPARNKRNQKRSSQLYEAIGSPNNDIFEGGT